MSQYYAPKPEYTPWEWVGYIGLRIILPPLLIWDCLQWATNALAGESVGRIVLPAQNKNFEEHSRRAYWNFALSQMQHTVITHDGAALDTLEIRKNKLEDTPAKTNKYIINFVGNEMAYEDIMHEMEADASQLGQVVIGFNFRGVFKSSGKARSANDLVIDGIAQVQRLLDADVPAQHITLKAHSLGAGVASVVAHHFHQKGFPVNIFIGRTFSSITNLLVGHIRLLGSETGHKESTLGILLGWLAKPFIKLAVSLVNWEIDAEDAFRAIPDAYKEYVCVRTEKSQRDDKIDDPIIPHYASIHAALKSERGAQKSELNYLIKKSKAAAKNADPLTRANIKASEQLLREARTAFKARKMTMTNKYDFGDSHVCQLGQLKNTSGQSGEAFFKAFLQRADQDHGINPMHAVFP